ncbi:MAG: AAA family ATPase [Coriobacteriales bacterium]|nr:AAA family ATPase [Coriobacteriales bacterium]
MRFYGREKESEQLAQWDALTSESGQMTIVLGRRRVGKTTLIKRSLIQRSSTSSLPLYFFVAKKSEALLCAEFMEIVARSLGQEIPGDFKRFKEVFLYVIQAAENRSITLIIDEFQEFLRVNSSIYSEMQDIWDSYKDRCHLHLVLCGSVYSLMKRIFEDSREPLFQRANHRMFVRPFDVDTQKLIYREHAPQTSNSDFLVFYAVAGGIPRYIELLLEEGAFSSQQIIDATLKENSFFLDEGRNVTVEEFGRDYATYFSVLSLIASGKSSRAQIEGTLERSVGPYLEQLESEFSYVRRVTPLFSKPTTRQIRYAVNDNFLTFWFRYIYRNRSAVELGNYDYVRQAIARDFPSYLGRVLERYFIDKLAISGEFSSLGQWWKGNGTDEIDMVAVNEMERVLLFGDIKLNPDKLSLHVLEKKAASIVAAHQDYEVTFKGFSLEDM